MKDPKRNTSREDQEMNVEHAVDDCGDFEKKFSAIGRMLDETWRVCRQEQARNDAHLQKRQFELEDRFERPESDAGDDGSA